MHMQYNPTAKYKYANTEKILLKTDTITLTYSLPSSASMSSTSYLPVVVLYTTTSASIQFSSSSGPLTWAATISPGLAMNPLSTGTALHSGGGLQQQSRKHWLNITVILGDATKMSTSLLCNTVKHYCKAMHSSIT